MLFLWLLTLPMQVRAGVEQITAKEFQQLAQELAPKVDLFRDIWEKDPAAEFYGGTTRDFLYWVKGKFRGAESHEQALQVMKQLRQREQIDIKEFLMPDSDVDII